jgi:hypothetical protein
MKELKIAATDDSPEIHLDSESGTFLISGKSLPEDVVEFYQPVLDWLEGYSSAPLEETAFDFKLIYFNTASSKLILDILMLLEEIHQKGHEVLIRWHSPETDEDMQDAGEEYAELVELPFKYITYS